MVCNTLVGILYPPAWRVKLQKLGKNTRRFLGYTYRQILISFGSDVDLVTDYLYLDSAIRLKNVPFATLTALKVVVAISSFIWLLEVLEGRLGFKQCLGFRLKNSRILTMAVMFEDIPQIVLTLMIDMVYPDSFTIGGVVNIAASVHNVLTKATALLDGAVIDDDEDDESDALLADPDTGAGESPVQSAAGKPSDTGNYEVTC